MGRESIVRCLDEYRDDLRSQFPSPLEKLLVDEVVLSWLQLRWSEIQVASTQGAEARRMNAVLKQQTEAKKRFDGATKQLMTVHRQLASKSAGGKKSQGTTKATKPSLDVFSDRIGPAFDDGAA